MDCSTPGFPALHHLWEFAQTHVHRVGDAIQPSRSLLSASPPAFSPSQHRGLFQWVSSLHQVAKVLELQLQHQFFQWIFRLISFRIDWFDLLKVQGTLKSLFQHCSSKASILQCSTFFVVFMMWLVLPLSSVHFPHMLVSKPDLSILSHGSVYPGQSVQDLITVSWCRVLMSERDQSHFFPLPLQSCLGWLGSVLLCCSYSCLTKCTHSVEILTGIPSHWRVNFNRMCTFIVSSHLKAGVSIHLFNLHYSFSEM